MPRRRKGRRLASQPQAGWFHPVTMPQRGLIPQQGEVELEPDELEAMRLVDLERQDQSAAGKEMGVSRGTVQRLLYSGRRKATQALLEGRPIRIKGSTRTETALQCASCGYQWPALKTGGDGFLRCIRCGGPYVYKLEQMNTEVS